MTAAVLPTAEALRDAVRALRTALPVTPLVESASLSRLAGVPVHLKCEQWQPMGAFKARGAFTAVRRLSADARARGLVTHSSGNHGQAVAWAAEQAGLRAVIVMPRTAPRIKVEGVRRFGGEIVFVDPVPSARAAKAEALAAEQGLTLIPPYEHDDVILGQATCAWEILEQEPSIRTILAPIGGGGLLAGTSVAVRTLGVDARVVGVEPEGAAKLTAALAAGHPVTLPETHSVADGLLPLSVGRLTFQYMHQVVREAVRVSDDEIGSAVKHLYDCSGLRVEPSGAVGVAALLHGRIELTTPTAIVCTGGNIEPALFARLTA